VPREGEVVILHRALLDNYTKVFIAMAMSKGCYLIYDTDDLIFEKNASDYLVRIGKKNYRDYELFLHAMQACHHVTVSTEFLAQRARKYCTSVSVILNGLSSNYLQVADNVYKLKKQGNFTGITLAYLSGSSTHNRDFEIIESALFKVLKKHPNVKLLLIGPLRFKREFYRLGKQFEHRAFIPYAEYTHIFSEIDLNLVPLEQNEMFCQAKSELKFIEAGICGVPSLVTPTHPHRKAISNGVDSIFAEDNEWEQQLDFYLDDPERLRNMGDRARKKVLQLYSPQLRSQQWQKHITKSAYLQKALSRDFIVSRFLIFLGYRFQILKKALRNIKNG
jgi:glycosyltransferase involved in cell wall biosynthesis